MLEAGVFEPLVNLDFIIETDRGGQPTTVGELVGFEEKEFDRVIDRDFIYYLMSCLTDKEKSVIQMCYFEDMSHKQIADIYKCTGRNITNICCNAIKKMKNKHLLIEKVKSKRNYSVRKSEDILTKDQIEEIRATYKKTKDCNITALSKRFKVSHMTISRILNRKGKYEFI